VFSIHFGFLSLQINLSITYPISVLVSDKTGIPDIIKQDSITLKKDTLSGAIYDSINLPSKPDTFTIQADTSQIQSPTVISGNDSLFLQLSISSDENYSSSLTETEIAFDNIPYYISDTFNLYQNIQSLRSFDNHYFAIKETSDLIFKEEVKSSGSLIPADFKQNQDKTLNQDLHPDWLIGIIIGSLIILAWLKLFYHKFFDQVIVSMWNFQLGSKFLRDQGIFARRVGLVLNLNFLLIGGLFIYLVLTHFNFNPLSLKPIFAYFLYTAVLTILLLIRYIITITTGYIFNKQDYFREYLYHILVIYKNLGVFLIPIIFCISYIQENLRIYFIFFALALVAMAYLFRFIKGFQLLIKKDVLIFYLILYLCTLEFLPVLFYYKFFSGWI
jgi:hypothetical protein